MLINWQTCENPHECLLFVQCASTSSIEVDGKNMCRYLFARSAWDQFDANILENRANVSRWELGCNHTHVKCLPEAVPAKPEPANDGT